MPPFGPPNEANDHATGADHATQEAGFHSIAMSVSWRLSAIYINLYIYIYLYLSIYLSTYLPTYLSIYLSIYL